MGKEPGDEGIDIDGLVDEINAHTAYLDPANAASEPSASPSRKWYLLWWMPSHCWVSDNTLHFLLALVLGGMAIASLL